MAHFVINVAPQRSPGPLSGRKRPPAGGTRGKSPAKKTKSQTGIYNINNMIDMLQYTLCSI